MMRYLMRRLSDKRSWRWTAAMIPLGSCTMKLNAAAEMIPDQLARVFGRCIRSRPPDQTLWAIREAIDATCETWLCEITGYRGVFDAAQLGQRRANMPGC